MDLTDDTTGTDSRDTGSGSPVSFLHGHVEGGKLDKRLPRGQHELPRQFVAEHQRRRILESMTHVLHEVGYLDLTVADVVKGAHVSRRTFYEHFTDKRHCYVATFGAGVECMADAVRTAYSAEQDWDDRVAAAFSTLVRLVIDHPETGHTCMVQGGICGTEAERARLMAMRMCADGYRAMLGECDAAREITALEAELAVGAIAELLRTRLSERREGALAFELPDMVVALLSSPIGQDRAQAIAGRIAVPAEAVATAEQHAAGS